MQKDDETIQFAIRYDKEAAALMQGICSATGRTQADVASAAIRYYFSTLSFNDKSATRLSDDYVGVNLHGTSWKRIKKELG